MYKTMTWVDEWRDILKKKSSDSFQSYPINFRTDIYDALCSYCDNHELVYFPSMYDEFMMWMYVTNVTFSYETIQEYANYSIIIKKQRKELNYIRDLEQFARAERIRFYDDDSIMEKISLVTHYMGLRGGG